MSQRRYVKIMEKKYQIFVSSTYEDLKEERIKIIKVIEKMGGIPSNMEFFCAQPQRSWDIICKELNETDYFVLIIGNQYGSISPEDSNLSFTEKEYEYAKKCGVPIVAFLLDEDSDLYKVSEQTEELKNFKKKVKSERNVEKWSNSDDLANKVSIALHKAIQNIKRPGWKRQVNSNQCPFVISAYTIGKEGININLKNTSGYDILDFENVSMELWQPHDCINTFTCSCKVYPIIKKDEDVNINFSCDDFIISFGNNSSTKQMYEGCTLKWHFKYRENDQTEYHCCAEKKIDKKNFLEGEWKVTNA